MARIDKYGFVEQEVIFANGVNLNKDPKVVRDDQLVWAANSFPTQSGILFKRPGITPFQLAAQGQLFPITMFVPNQLSGYKYLVQSIFGDGGSTPLSIPPLSVLTATNAEDVDGVGGIQDASALFALAAADSAPIVNPLCYANHQNFTVMCDGREGIIVFGPFAGQYTIQAANFTTNSQTQTIPVMPKVCCSYQGRMRYFNLGPGYEHYMLSADFASITLGQADILTQVGSDVLSQNGRALALNSIAGESITAAFEAQLMSVGSPLQACLVVLTDKSCLICTGDITQTTDTNATNPNLLIGDFVANKVNYKVGCVSPATIAKTPYGYVWASDSDVWMLSGNQPIKIGTNITQALQATPPEARKFWSGAYCYAPGVYVLDMIKNRGADDRYLQHEQWWLQLNDAEMPRNANEAKWFGPMSVVRDDGESAFHGPVLLDSDEQRIIKLVCEPGYGNVGDLNYCATLCDISSTNNQVDDITAMQAPSALEWQPATDYAIGDVVRQSFGNGNVGTLWVCLVAGTSDVVEPTWTQNPGDTLVDGGTLQWQEIMGSGHFRMLNYDTTSYLNAMSVRSKEFGMGAPQVDKIYERVDLIAYSSLPQLITPFIVGNQGAKRDIAGFGMYGQKNNLAAGMTPLDSALISDGEFESKGIRPGASNRIRNKFTQLEIKDGWQFFHPSAGSIIIDENSNSLVFGVFAGGTGVYMFQANLTANVLGVYGALSMDTLLDAIVTAMDTAMLPATFFGSITTHAGAWGKIAPGASNGFPYFNNFSLAFTGSAAGIGVGLFYGDSDAMDLSAYPTILSSTATPFDLNKSKRLMAILGFDTDTNVGVNGLDAIEGSLPTNVFFQYGTGVSPIYVYGKNQIANQRSSKIALASAIIRGQVTNAPPLGFSNR